MRSWGLNLIATTALAALVVCGTLAYIENTTIAQDTATWTAEEPEVTPAPAEEGDAPEVVEYTNDGFKATMSEVAARKGITPRERRKLGITLRNMLRVSREMYRSGEIDKGMARSELAVAVLERLMDDNPRAFANDKLDFDAILDFIERLIPLIMRLIEMFESFSMMVPQLEFA